MPNPYRVVHLYPKTPEYPDPLDPRNFRPEWTECGVHLRRSIPASKRPKATSRTQYATCQKCLRIRARIVANARSRAGSTAGVNGASTTCGKR